MVSWHLCWWKLINAEIVCIKFPLISYANNINGTYHSSSDKFPGTDLKFWWKGQALNNNIQENLVFFPLVYDTSSRETFQKLEEWPNEIEMYSTKKDIIKMLVGNKIDKVQWNFCVFILDQIIITRFLLLKTGVFSLNLNLEIKWISY